MKCINVLNKIAILLFLFNTLSSDLFSQSAVYKYWIGFTDKDNNGYSLNLPEEFLSERAIKRRRKQNIDYAYNDLPVTKIYVDSIRNTGVKVLYTSKWLNGAVIETSNQNLPYQEFDYSFIKEIKLLYYSNFKKSYYNKFDIELKENNSSNNLDYGKAELQVTASKGDFLHNKGYLGNGKLIAVLDAGFEKVDILPAFENLFDNNQILGVKDFVNDTSNIYNEHKHGTHVLSIMGGYYPGQLIGSAPNADYFLIRTEDINSEFPVEMYNWVAGAEFADSIGADIINSSLGYSRFDDPQFNYTYEDMDGNTTTVTRAADIAASKGILVSSSAGNNGDDDWYYITSPSDGDSVISVGAINRDTIKADFSSFGPRSDGEVKPNVMAVGGGTYFQAVDSNFLSGNGTSYSSPIIAGLSACLWQAFPEMSNMDIFRAIELSAHRYYDPNDEMGYGIANFKKAYNILSQLVIDDSTNGKKSIKFSLFPNPVEDEINIYLFNKDIEKTTIKIVNSAGNTVFLRDYSTSKLEFIYIPLDDFSFNNKGVYILYISGDGYKEAIKILKIR